MCHQARKSSAGCAIPGTRVGVRARIWGAWVQIGGKYRKAFNNVRSRTSPTRRRFRKESKSGSERNRWSFQSLPDLAIPIRVAKNRKIQQNRARAQRRIQHRPPSVSFWDPTSRPQLAQRANCGHQSAFLLTGRGRFLWARPKENGGASPVSGHLQKIDRPRQGPILLFSGIWIGIIS